MPAGDEADDIAEGRGSHGHRLGEPLVDQRGDLAERCRLGDKVVALGRAAEGQLPPVDDVAHELLREGQVAREGAARLVRVIPEPGDRAEHARNLSVAARRQCRRQRHVGVLAGVHQPEDFGHDGRLAAAVEDDRGVRLLAAMNARRAVLTVHVHPAQQSGGVRRVVGAVEEVVPVVVLADHGGARALGHGTTQHHGHVIERRRVVREVAHDQHQDAGVGVFGRPLLAGHLDEVRHPPLAGVPPLACHPVGETLHRAVHAFDPIAGSSSGGARFPVSAQGCEARGYARRLRRNVFIRSVRASSTVRAAPSTARMGAA